MEKELKLSDFFFVTFFEESFLFFDVLTGNNGFFFFGDWRLLRWNGVFVTVIFGNRIWWEFFFSVNFGHSWIQLDSKRLKVEKWSNFENRFLFNQFSAIFNSNFLFWKFSRWFCLNFFLKKKFLIFFSPAVTFGARNSTNPTPSIYHLLVTSLFCPLK